MNKPISDAQMAANRANAQKSTGPRTEEGKAISSQNALKHGVYSRSDILDGEFQEAFGQNARRNNRATPASNPNWIVTNAP